MYLVNYYLCIRYLTNMACELCLYYEHPDRYFPEYYDNYVSKRVNKLCESYKVPYDKTCIKNILCDLDLRLPSLDKIDMCDYVTFSETLLFSHINTYLQNNSNLIKLLINLVNRCNINIICILDVLIGEILKISPIDDLMPALLLLDDRIRLEIIKIMDKYDLINPSTILKYLRGGPTVKELTYFMDNAKYINDMFNIWELSHTFCLICDLPLFIKLESIWGPCSNIEILLQGMYDTLPHNFNENSESLHILKYILEKYDDAHVTLTNILKKRKDCRLLEIVNTYA